MMTWNDGANLKDHINNLNKIASEVIKFSTSNKILQKFWMKGINDLSESFINKEIERHNEATPLAFERIGKFKIKDKDFEISELILAKPRFASSLERSWCL